MILRFDFRLAPSSPATMSELYATALDMCEWGEQHGAMMAMFSEHHASSDSYLPSPIVLASAAAGRTSTLAINVGALLLLMYDPVKLAEDMAVLDHLSNGRVGYTIGLGYRDEEYAMFGIDPATRGAEIEERISVVQRALAGESFDWRGRTISVRPGPQTPGATPMLAYGGGSKAAARRAARHAMLFFPQTSDPALAAAYDTEAARVGTPLGMTMAPAEGAPTSVFVAEDVDAGWAAMGEYLLHDARMYSEWMGAAASASASGARTVDALRSEGGAYRIVTPAQAVELKQIYGTLALQPLCGGMPPELAWQSLRLIESQVLPALA